MKAKFTSPKTLFKTSEVQYLDHKIIRNSILHIPATNEPVFFLIQEIVVNENDTFVLR